MDDFSFPQLAAIRSFKPLPFGDSRRVAVPLIVVSDVLKEFREEFKIKFRREGALWLP